MSANDTPMTTGYEYPRPFQPQGKAEWQKSLLAKGKKRVIGKKKRPVVKKRT